MSTDPAIAALYGSIGASGRVSEDERFPDPFMDMASLAMPQTPAEALRWSEFIVGSNGTYRQAIRRIVSYFITDIQVQQKGSRDLSSEVQEKYKNFFNDELGICKLLVTIGQDYLIYGNSFTSLMLPIKRYLHCNSCHSEFPLRKMHDTPSCKFRWSDFEFSAVCPICRKEGTWRHVDRRLADTKLITVKRWSPHEIEIAYEPTSNHKEYIWKIPETDRAEIQRGNLHYLENTCWEVIEAVRDKKNLLFDKGAIFHMCEEPPAGLRNRGWGISQVLSNFRQAWYVQMLKRQNEAIVLDFLVPVRMLTPESRQGATAESSDPYTSLGMGSFVSSLERALAKRRKDPARFNILPFPVKYQLLGGEASQLAPTELIEQAENCMLNAIGTPVEFYQGTLAVQSAPSTLRLFEAAWSHLVHSLNEFLEDVSEQLSESLAWEPAKVQLERVSHADDLNRQMAQLQLMMSGMISKSTGLKSVGVNYPDELRKSLDEQRLEAEEQARSQKEMEQSQMMEQLVQQLQSGQPQQGQPAAGDPAAAGGAPPGFAAPVSAVDQFMQQKTNNPNMPVTPQDLESQAQSIAQELLTKPDTERRSALVKLRQTDKTMATLVQGSIEKQRYDARMQGGAALMQQPQQKAASLRSVLGNTHFMELSKL
jgi:hypothetical protein